MGPILLFSALLFLNSGLMMGQQIDDKKNLELKKRVKESVTDSAKVFSLVALGEYQVYRDFSEAEGYVKNAIQIVNGNKTLLKKGFLAFPYNTMGIIKRKQGDYVGAIKYLLKAKEIFDRIEDSSNVANVLHNTGVVYRYLKEHSKSIQSFTSAISILEKIDENKKGLAASYNMLGVSYRQIKKLDSALIYYQKAKTIFKELNSEEDLYKVSGNLAVLYYSKKQYDKSLELNMERLAYYTKLGNRSSMASTNYNISSNYKKLKDWPKALTYASTSLEIAKEEGFKARISKAHSRIARIHYENKNFKLAYENYRLHKKYSDSVLNDKNIKKLQRLEVESVFRKEKLNDSLQLVKELEVAEANAKVLVTKNKIKEQWILFGGLGLFTVFIILYLLRSRSFDRKKQKLQGEFSRNLIKGQEEERIRLARELHDGIGQKFMLLRKNVTSLKNPTLASLAENTIEELRNISRGLHPANIEKLGITAAIESLVNEVDAHTDIFFTHEIDNIDQEVNKEASIHLYRIIQEALNNMVKHANAKAASVTIEGDNSSIKATIRDNGKGFEFSEKVKQSTSLGMKTLIERAKIIHSSLKIESSPNKGTTIQLIIPTYS